MRTDRSLPSAERLDHFEEAYRFARREAFVQAIGLTQRSSSAAVATLLRIMHDPKATRSAWVSAPTNVLKFARKSIELDDLAVRVVKLERSMSEEENK